MKKLPRYGLLLFILLLLGLALPALGAQPVYANEDAEAVENPSNPADKEEAIKAANEAIDRVPRARFIVSLEQVTLNYIHQARGLVETAKEYGATDNDFPHLNKLVEAEEALAKLEAVEAAKEAIRAIPPLGEITADDRELIEEARRLVNIAVDDYGATRFDICWLYDYLIDAEDVLPDVEEPEPEPKPEPLPPTGTLTASLVAGTLLTGTGIIFALKRRGRRY